MRIRLFSMFSGFSVTKKNLDCKVYIFNKHLTELQETMVNKSGVTIGAAVSLSDMKDILEHWIQELPNDKTKLFRQIIVALEPIASEQILNLAVSMYNEFFAF